MSCDIEVVDKNDMTGAIREDDIIIAFMGLTGSGKSFFIDLLTNQKGKRANNKLKPSMSEIESTYVKHSKYPGRRIILVDTPGFDDTEMSDREVLDKIGKWLNSSYEKYVKLTGIIYLHRIADNRVGGSQYRNFRMFGELVGNDAMKNVILVSTLWNRVSQEVGESRERELQETFWASMIKEGSRTDRLAQTTSEDAWRVVDRLIQDRDAQENDLLEYELVELKEALGGTRSGGNLYAPLQKLLGEQRMALRKMPKHAIQPSSEEVKELEREIRRIEKQFEKTLEEATKIKISIGRRIILFFLGTRVRKLGGGPYRRASVDT